MCVQISISGLPGSGKSTAIHTMLTTIKDAKRKVKIFNDYDILHTMFLADVERLQFSEIPQGGFDVHDYRVFDIALKEVEQQVTEQATSKEDFIIIEFSRNDYLHALKQFSASFLRDTYFLFIDAENITCKNRAQQRHRDGCSNDDHYVSDYIFEAYYCNGREYAIAASLNGLSDQHGELYEIDVQKIAIVNNTSDVSMQDFCQTIERLTLQIMQSKPIAFPDDVKAQLAPLPLLNKSVESVEAQK